jgi:soluble lytic murein transglycosylase-like protein
VTGYRLEGDRLLLRMAGGGEMALPVTEVVEIRREPDPTPGGQGQNPVALPATPPPASEPERPSAADGAANSAPASAPSPAAAESGGNASLLPVGGVFDRDALVSMAAAIARRHGVDATLVHAVITIESHYDPFAVSPRGAMGLMQLMPKTAARFQVENAFDPEQNVDGGVRYLKELLERYSGQVRLALAAYNAGEEAVERHSGIPPYRETVNYVMKVQRLARR